MPKDTLGLNLNGDVTLDLFAEALEHFSKLADALVRELIGPGEKVVWEIQNLEAGSAHISVKAIYQNDISIEKIPAALAVIGHALEQRETIPYSDAVAFHARAVTRIINGRIGELEFIAGDERIPIKERVEEDTESRRTSMGVVTGIIEAINARPNLVLTLYDTLFNKAVHCHLESDQERLARDVWRKRVSVTGLIYRNIDTGRPEHIRHITKIELVEQSPPGSYVRAKGVFDWHDGDEPAEATIRRLRDAS